MIRLVTALVLTAGAARAEMLVQNTTYTCDRGLSVPVVYVNDPDQSIAVLQVDGRQILLYAETAGSGARYSWPSDGSNYIWSVSDEAAVLAWRDGEAGTETPILACNQS